MNIFTQLGLTISAGQANIPTTSATNVVANGLNIIYFVVGIAAVAVIIIAGFLYVTSQGKSTNVTRAKDAILYAVIGLVVVIIAFSVTKFVIGAVK